jgi:hypothetical protein
MNNQTDTNDSMSELNVSDLIILVDANKEMADKAEFAAKRLAIRLKLAIVLLNEAAPIMEKHYLRKRWFEGVNELNSRDEK